MNASYITPAITTLNADGSLDTKSQANLYEHLIANHIDGILVLGSIGEFFALPLEKKYALAEFAIRTVAHRTRLIIGTGSMCFDEIAPFSNHCLKLGADAVIVIPPYYFTLDDEAVFRYFDCLARQIDGPLFIYNFPDRTGYSISPQVVLRLAQAHSHIIGIKDTLSGMSHTRELIKCVKPVRPAFEIFSGFDDNLIHNVLSGGDGCIGGLSNVFPEICTAWVEALRKNDLTAAAKYQQTINQLFDIYAIGSSFVPVIKEAARQRGIVASSTCTFPIPSISKEQADAIARLMQSV